MFNIFMVLFCIALIGAVAFAVARFRKFSQHNANHSTNQLDFIKHQYDTGEISKSQYEQLIRDLTK